MNVPMLPDHVELIVSSLPMYLHVWLQKNPGACVAGGYCRALIAGEQPKDIDVWTPGTINTFEVACDFVETRDYLEFETSHNAWNVVRKDGSEPPMSFIECHRPTSLDDCLDHFDFTVCQAGVHWDAATRYWKGRVGGRFYADLAGRRIVVREEGLDSPMGSFERVCRYVARGYTIAGSERRKVALAINRMTEDEVRTAISY